MAVAEGDGGCGVMAGWCWCFNRVPIIPETQRKPQHPARPVHVRDGKGEELRRGAGGGW